MILMYRLIILINTLVVWVCCHAETYPKTVCIVFSSDGLAWRLRINHEQVTEAKIGDLTNQVTKLKLHVGDVVLLQKPTYKEKNSLEKWVQWLARYCESNRVALYLFTKDGNRNAIFSLPIYHWSCPETDSGLTNTVFLKEGKLLGLGKNGFNALLDDIDKKKPQKICILGSYSYINVVPYEEQFDLLENTLKRNNTILLHPSDLPGY